jgi:hypothetical protein
LDLQGHWEQRCDLIASNKEALLYQIIGAFEPAVFVLDAKDSVITDL